MTTSRREFLITTVTGAGAVLVAQACGGMAPKDSSPGPSVGSEQLPETKVGIRAVLRRYFDGADRRSVQTIGGRYMQRFETDEAAAEDLKGAVTPIAEIDTLEGAVEALEAGVEADFEGPKLAAVAGWQLARTEARLCGLAHQIGFEAEDG